MLRRACGLMDDFIGLDCRGRSKVFVLSSWAKC